MQQQKKQLFVLHTCLSDRKLSKTPINHNFKNSLKALPTSWVGPFPFDYSS